MALGKVRSLEEMKKERPKLYHIHDLDLAVARRKEEFYFAGNNMRVVDASDLDAEIDVYFNELFYDAIPMRIGRMVEMTFYRYFVSHAAQAGKTIKLAVAMETELFDIRDDVIPWVGVRTPGAEASSYAQVTVTDAFTLIKAANANRRSIVVQNLIADPLYLGYDVSVTTANYGHRLAEWEAIELFFTGTIYGIRDAAKTGAAGYLEEANI